MTLLFIALAGGFGAVCRYVIYEKMKKKVFPKATFLINLLGCFLLGLFIEVSSSIISLMITIGFLGGFTTYSTYMYESFELFQSKHLKVALLYSSLTIILGALLVLIGMSFARTFI
jgi:fluoride exporter